MKKSSTDARSSSSDSTHSSHSAGSITPTKGLLSQSPVRQSPVRNLSNTSQGSSTSVASSTGFVPSTHGQQQHLHQQVVQSLASSKHPLTNLESSGYFSFRESRIAMLMPTLSEDSTSSSGSSRVDVDTTVDSGVGSMGSTGSTRGTKRKLPLGEESQEDDCVIIGEGQITRTDSDTANNNAKRPRNDTIVID